MAVKIKTSGTEGEFEIEVLEIGINIYDKWGFLMWWYWEDLEAEPGAIEAYGIEEIIENWRGENRNDN